MSTFVLLPSRIFELGGFLFLASYFLFVSFTGILSRLSPSRFMNVYRGYIYRGSPLHEMTDHLTKSRIVDGGRLYLTDAFYVLGLGCHSLGLRVLKTRRPKL